MKLSSKQIVLCVMFLSRFALAQVSTGTPPYGSFGGGPFDIVNLGNLNVHFSIPVLHKAGRGTAFTYDLSYDSSIWTPVTSNGVTQWQPASNWGWRGLTEAQTGYLSYQTSFTTGVGGCRTTYYSYTYHDAFGALHAFPGTAQEQNYFLHGSCIGSAFSPLNATASDGSGYHLSVTSFVQLAGQLTDRGGGLIAAPLNTTTGAATYTDNNGNQLSVSSGGVFTDTLGTTPLTVSGSGTPASPTVFAYTAPSGARAQYQMKYTNYTVGTAFGISGVNEYGPVTNVPLVSSIQLPDQTSYQFTYEPGPSSCSPCVTGRLQKVTLPAGGVITYSYTGIESDGSTAGMSRQLSGITNGGTWSYARTKQNGTAPGPGSTWQTLVTDPNLNKTYINFAEDSTTTSISANTQATYNLYETWRQINQLINGTQTALLTTEHCYNGNDGSSCATATVSSPVTTIDSYAQPANGYVRASHVEYNGSFNGSGLVSRDQEYDYTSTLILGGSLSSLNALRDTRISYANLSNQYGPIYNKPASAQLWDCSTGACSQLLSTTYTYDQAIQSTSGVPQHVSITGSRGDLTTVTVSPANVHSPFTKTFSYYDTGNVYVATDVNGAQTTYGYGSDCGYAFPVTIAEPLSLSRSMTWNCTGGVLTQATDENGNAVNADYTSDPYYWRPDSTTDLASNTTTLEYKTSSVESALQNFNGGSSAWDFLVTVDGFGRVAYNQQLQAPKPSNYDTVETDYNAVGLPSRITMPYSATGNPSGNSSVAGSNISYDALGRVVSIAQGTSSSTSYQAAYQYIQNDVLVTVGKSGGQQFIRNLEYDGLGRLTSVCEVTSVTGSGACGQRNSKTGFLTTYTYDALGDLTSVIQNAQAQSGRQTRTYNYDGLGRMTSETNPETGTTFYTWDYLASGYCGATSQPGDLMHVVNADGSQICYIHDQLHRLTTSGGSTPPVCRRFRYDNDTLGNVLYSPPANFPGQNLAGRLVEAETDTCGWPPTSQTWITDEWFSYDANGHIPSQYQSTRNSAGFYHTIAAYQPTGALGGLQLLTPTQGMTPDINYPVDAEGRVSGVTSSLGQNPVTSVTYSSSTPLGAITKVTLGSGDYDSFTYDPNTGAMTQYAATIGATPQTMTGTLTFSPNANGTIQSLNIVDPFNTSDNQTCNYGYDDLIRVTGANCGSAWNQPYSYDAFGNITKTTGGSDAWTPTYNNPSNNQYQTGWTGGGAYPVSYDGNGRLTDDTMNSYTWDTWGDLATATPNGTGNTTTLTYDAFGRMVESSSSGGTQQYIYSTTGGPPLATARAQVLLAMYLPLPGGAIAMIGNNGPWQYNHPDWLGSARVFSSPAQVATKGFAYAPFGEGYAQSSNQWIQFTETGNAWTVGGNNNQGGALDDFMFRRYNPGQGRWISPDPAGLAAVDPTNPQTWNRYAYVANNPLSFVDPLGLNAEDPSCSWDDSSNTLTCSGGGGVDPSGGDPCFLYGLNCPNQPGSSNGPSGAGGGRVGNAGGSGAGVKCVQPTRVQKLAISLASVSAQTLGYTVLWGIGGSAGVGFGKGVGAYGSISAQIAVSPNGNAAYVLSFSAPAIIAGQDTPGVLPYVVPSTKGAGVLGGAQFGLSNATDPSQLAGPSVDASFSSADGVGIGGDFSLSTGAPYPWQGNVTLGFGLGGRGAAGAITNTTVIPICKSGG
jgi:RHS repeat-associated protein